MGIEPETSLTATTRSSYSATGAPYIYIYTTCITYLRKDEGRAKKRKGIEAQRVKPPNLFRAIDALIGDEEPNGKQEKKKKKKKN